MNNTPKNPLTWKHWLAATLLVLSAILNFSHEIQSAAAACGIPLPRWINFALLAVVAFCDSVLPVVKRLWAEVLNDPNIALGNPSPATAPDASDPEGKL